MQKVKLEDELLSGKAEKKRQFEADGSVNEVKLLLAGEEQEDLRILKGIGVNSTIVQIEQENGKRIELEKLDRDFAGNVFEVGDIEKLCIKYRLRFLPSTLFVGNIEARVALKIKEFAKVTKTEIDEYTLRTRFLIMAPPESFRLQRVQFVRTVKDPDPLIFYKISDTKYRLIHKWGNDFSILRRLLGFRWANLRNYWLTNFFLLLPIATLLVCMVIPATVIIQKTLPATLLVLIVTAFFTCWMNRPVTDEHWFDSERGFFTPWNWNISEKLKS